MHTSPQLINLTVTAYAILQGIAPAFFGELSDKVGRRPVYVISFGIYVAANTGLAIQNRYAALLLLRMLQSLGASATVAIGYGVVADIATPAERGRVLGPAMVGKYIHQNQLPPLLQFCELAYLISSENSQIAAQITTNMESCYNKNKSRANLGAGDWRAAG